MSQEEDLGALPIADVTDEPKKSNKRTRLALLGVSGVVAVIALGVGIGLATQENTSLGEARVENSFFPSCENYFHGGQFCHEGLACNGCFDDGGETVTFTECDNICTSWLIGVSKKTFDPVDDTCDFQDVEVPELDYEGACPPGFYQTIAQRGCDASPSEQLLFQANCFFCETNDQTYEDCVDVCEDNDDCSGFFVNPLDFDQCFAIRRRLEDTVCNAVQEDSTYCRKRQDTYRCRNILTDFFDGVERCEGFGDRPVSANNEFELARLEEACAEAGIDPKYGCWADFGAEDECFFLRPGDENLTSSKCEDKRAFCCERITDAPTPEFTGRPTENPTQNPIRSPTNSPIKNPTNEPTNAPTSNPTIKPTSSPVEDPFVVVPTPSPIGDAPIICTENGATLAFPQNSDEFEIMRQECADAMPSCGCWLNIFVTDFLSPSNKVFTALDGTIPFLNFGPGSPTNFQDDEDGCVILDPLTGFLMNDVDCARPCGDAVNLPVPLCRADTNAPTTSPTIVPTPPTGAPTGSPTTTPTNSPTDKPTGNPTENPTNNPIAGPTENPTNAPSDSPTKNPTRAINPTTNPTRSPTFNPTRLPTEARPTENPTRSPTFGPTKLPSESPTQNPTKNPTRKPTQFPTESPTFNPTRLPTQNPTANPTTNPTTSPTRNPTKNPTTAPTDNPTRNPTSNPTNNPTQNPTKNPTGNPTTSPTNNPTKNPTTNPTRNPTKNPTSNPTQNPTENPTRNPTQNPTQNPTRNPTNNPTKNPTRNPTQNPTSNPTRNPTKNPTKNPTANPTENPTANPTQNPTVNPTKNPTKNPTNNPTRNPTQNPTQNPTENPTKNPTTSPTRNPTTNPTTSPTDRPTINPTNRPTESPTKFPTQNPTTGPTQNPTTNPTKNPTENPTSNPTRNPTKNPTKNPTVNPTVNPTKNPTQNPTVNPTKNPTVNPTNNPTRNPTVNPTNNPTVNPTNNPTRNPTGNPTKNPTTNPTNEPTRDPTRDPTQNPTANPTTNPTANPTQNPTTNPTNNPTTSPTNNPTRNPTTNPTNNPTDSPTQNPTKNPTFGPTRNPTVNPTTEPTGNPTSSPTFNPTTLPTANPTRNPTPKPTDLPTANPNVVGICKFKNGEALWKVFNDGDDDIEFHCYYPHTGTANYAYDVTYYPPCSYANNHCPLSHFRVKPGKCEFIVAPADVIEFFVFGRVCQGRDSYFDCELNSGAITVPDRLCKCEDHEVDSDDFDRYALGKPKDKSKFLKEWSRFRGSRPFIRDSSYHPDTCVDGKCLDLIGKIRKDRFHYTAHLDLNQQLKGLTRFIDFHCTANFKASGTRRCGSNTFSNANDAAAAGCLEYFPHNYINIDNSIQVKFFRPNDDLLTIFKFKDIPALTDYLDYSATSDVFDKDGRAYMTLFSEGQKVYANHRTNTVGNFFDDLRVICCCIELFDHYVHDVVLQAQGPAGSSQNVPLERSDITQILNRPALDDFNVNLDGLDESTQVYSLGLGGETILKFHSGFSYKIQIFEETVLKCVLNKFGANCIFTDDEEDVLVEVSVDGINWELVTASIQTTAAEQLNDGNPHTKGWQLLDPYATFSGSSRRLQVEGDEDDPDLNPETVNVADPEGSTASGQDTEYFHKSPRYNSYVGGTARTKVFSFLAKKIRFITLKLPPQNSCYKYIRLQDNSFGINDADDGFDLHAIKTTDVCCTDVDNDAIFEERQAEADAAYFEAFAVNEVITSTGAASSVVLFIIAGIAAVVFVVVGLGLRREKQRERAASLLDSQQPKFPSEKDLSLQEI